MKDIVSKYYVINSFFLGVFRPLFDEIMYLSQELLLFVGRFNDLFVFVNVFSVNVLIFIIGIIKLTVTQGCRNPCTILILHTKNCFNFCKHNTRTKTDESVTVAHGQI